MTIAHATALSPEEHYVFEHALALACAAEARLFTVNARDGSEERAAPDAEQVLLGWGRAGDGVKHEALIHSCCDDPIDTLLDALRRVAPDLIVAGTHQRGRAQRLLGGSQCEALLRNVTQPTLVFPVESRSLLTSDGRLDLRRIVVPIGDEATAKAALEQARWLGSVTGAEALDINLIFVGNEADAPTVTMAEHTGWTVHRTTADKGGVAAAVVAAAGEACIVVMATRGADSLKDSLFGTNAEQVLRQAKCPVLVTPV